MNASAYLDELEKISQLEKDAFTPALALKMMGSGNKLVRGAGGMMGRAMGHQALPGVNAALRAGVAGGTGSITPALGYAAGHAAGAGLRRFAPNAVSRLPQQLQGLATPSGMGNLASYLT